MDTASSKRFGTSQNDNPQHTLRSLINSAYERGGKKLISLSLALDCTHSAPITLHETLSDLVDSDNVHLHVIHAPTVSDELNYAMEKNPGAILVTTEKNLFDNYKETNLALLLQLSDASLLESNAEQFFYNTQKKEDAAPAQTLRQPHISTRTFMTSGTTRLIPDMLTFIFHEHLYNPQAPSSVSPYDAFYQSQTKSSHGICSSDFAWAAKLLSCNQKKKVGSVTVANAFPMNFDAALSTIATYDAICHLSKSKDHTYRQFSFNEVHDSADAITNLVIKVITQQSEAYKNKQPLPLLALFLSPHILKGVVNQLASRVKDNPELKSSCETFFGTIFTTGCSCDTDLIKNLFLLCPYIVMLNGYGPTEVVYGLPPKAYCNEKTVTDLFPESGELNKFIDYCTSSSIWPHNAAKVEPTTWAFSFPKPPNFQLLKTHPYKSLFVLAVGNLVPPDRAYHTLKKGDSLNQLNHNSEMHLSQSEGLFELTIEVNSSAFTSEESIIRTAPTSFNTGDICHFTDDGIMTWKQRIKYIKGPNNNKIVVSHYTDFIVESLSEAFYHSNEDPGETGVYCLPVEGQGIVTVIIEDPDNPLNSGVISKFLCLIRTEAAPCPEEVYVVSDSNILDNNSETSTGKLRSNEQTIKHALMKQLSDAQLHANLAEGEGGTRFTPGLHRLHNRKLPQGWRSLYSPPDPKKSIILSIIVKTLKETATFLPKEMTSSHIDPESLLLESTLLPDVPLTCLGLDSQGITAFRIRFLDNLLSTLGVKSSKETHQDWFPPSHIDDSQPKSTFNALIESMISPKLVGKKTLSELAEIIAEIFLINPVFLNRQDGILSSAYSSFQINRSTSKSTNKSDTPPDIIMIACSDITGGSASWWSSAETGLLNKIQKNIQEGNGINQPSIGCYTLSVPPLLTNNIKTIKNALTKVCNTEIFEKMPNAKVYVLGFSSGGIFSLLLKEIFPRISMVTLLDTFSPTLVFPLPQLHAEQSNNAYLNESIQCARNIFVMLLQNLAEVYNIQIADTVSTINALPINITLGTTSNSDKLKNQTYNYWTSVINTASKILPMAERFRIKSLWGLLLSLSENGIGHSFKTNDDDTIKLLAAVTSTQLFQNIPDNHTLGFGASTPHESVNHGKKHQDVPQSPQALHHILNVIRTLHPPSSPSLPTPASASNRTPYLWNDPRNKTLSSTDEKSISNPPPQIHD